MSDGDVAAVLARVGAGMFQQAWIVDDIASAELAMQSSLGCGEFIEFRMDEPWTLRGRQVACDLDLAFARSGDTQVELMHPVGGEGLLVDFLAERGPGLHHLGVLVDDLDDSIAAAAKDGFESPMAGQFAAVRLAFLDTFADLGLYIELIEDPKGLLWATKPWRDERPN